MTAVVIWCLINKTILNWNVVILLLEICWSTESNPTKCVSVNSCYYVKSARNSSSVSLTSTKTWTCEKIKLQKDLSGSQFTTQTFDDLCSLKLNKINEWLALIFTDQITGLWHLRWPSVLKCGDLCKCPHVVDPSHQNCSTCSGVICPQDQQQSITDQSQINNII